MLSVRRHLAFSVLTWAQKNRGGKIGLKILQMLCMLCKGLALHWVEEVAVWWSLIYWVRADGVLWMRFWCGRIGRRVSLARFLLDQWNFGGVGKHDGDWRNGDLYWNHLQIVCEADLERSMWKGDFLEGRICVGRDLMYVHTRSLLLPRRKNWIQSGTCHKCFLDSSVKIKAIKEEHDFWKVYWTVFRVDVHSEVPRYFSMILPRVLVSASGRYDFGDNESEFGLSITHR